MPYPPGSGLRALQLERNRMLRENTKIISGGLKTADLVITALSFLAAYAIRGAIPELPALRPFSEYSFLLIFILPLWAGLLRYYGAYGTMRTKSLTQTLVPVLKGSSAAVIVLMTLLYAFKLEYVSRALIIIFFVVNSALLLAFKASVLFLTRYLRTKGYNFRTMIIVGTGRRALEFARFIEEHKQWGVHVLGFVSVGKNDEPGPAPAPERVLGEVEGLDRLITTVQVDEVVFVVTRKLLDRIEGPVMACEQVGIKASIVMDLYRHKIAAMQMGEFAGRPVMTFNPVATHERGVLLKRALDVVFSALVLLLVSPFFLFASIGVKLTSPGPVFFRQERCGKNGRRFKVLKFRTMIEDADQALASLKHLNEMSGPVFKSRNDPRVTSFGRLLRKYSIDELPQFVNVLKGDMSIVGPRPPLPSEISQYDLAQRRRLSVKPGITCLWQVNGRNKIGFTDWVRLDLEYIDKWSFWLDLKIILKTVPAVLRGTGI